ncbi:MAG: hypothetical protein M5U26_10110 [Planctomycetota bacterium]|nr:hypothetical protein [Planctomycetota bacterium]
MQDEDVEDAEDQEARQAWGRRQAVLHIQRHYASTGVSDIAVALFIWSFSFGVLVFPAIAQQWWLFIAYCSAILLVGFLTQRFIKRLREHKGHYLGRWHLPLEAHPYVDAYHRERRLLARLSLAWVAALLGLGWYDLPERYVEVNAILMLSGIFLVLVRAVSSLKRSELWEDLVPEAAHAGAIAYIFTSNVSNFSFVLCLTFIATGIFVAGCVRQWRWSRWVSTLNPY